MRYTMENAPTELLKEVKQTFVYYSDVHRAWCASLLTTYNALSNSPSIDVGTFDSREQADAAVAAAFNTAFTTK